MSEAAVRRAGALGVVRCAVYTRKSSEEGLEQAFNSLDAQREACEAYIASQKHAGWVVLPAAYDDGGLSGASMDRPALGRLLADIEGGGVDAVVVYKVDRLTRSLSDFARIVDVFDSRGVSFVSVTQQFNTTTSMGRLTLNMLLSFAQFEREVTSERIRDKIAASKKKGLWMGGLAPLGYDVDDRRLIVNETEAETVRYIYRRYAGLGSVRALRAALDGEGVVSKVRVGRDGRESGGRTLGRGALYAMLRNEIYRGRIMHKGRSYPGRHAAIVDEALWKAVQERLAVNRVKRQTGGHAAEPSLLAGLMYDGAGERMTPTHTKKKGRRYRYYVSRSLIDRGRGEGGETGCRVPAGNIERLVTERITGFLEDEGAVFAAVGPLTGDENRRRSVVKQAAVLARRWPGLAPPAQRRALLSLVARVEIGRGQVTVRLCPGSIAQTAALGGEATDLESNPQCGPGPVLDLIVPARLKRAGMETRFVVDAPGGGARRAPERSLLRLLAQAHRYRRMLLDARGRSMGELAREAGVGRSYFSRIVRLGFLAPEAVEALLDGRHPPGLTANRLALHTRLPNAWEEQLRTLGIARHA